MPRNMPNASVRLRTGLRELDDGLMSAATWFVVVDEIGSALLPDVVTGFAKRNISPNPTRMPPTPPAAVIVLRVGPIGHTPASTPSIRLITLALRAPAWRA